MAREWRVAEAPPAEPARYHGQRRGALQGHGGRVARVPLAAAGIQSRRWPGHRGPAGGPGPGPGTATGTAPVQSYSSTGSAGVAASSLALCHGHGRRTRAAPGLQAALASAVPLEAQRPTEAAMRRFKFVLRFEGAASATRMEQPKRHATSLAGSRLPPLSGATTSESSLCTIYSMEAKYGRPGAGCTATSRLAQTTIHRTACGEIPALLHFLHKFSRGHISQARSQRLIIRL